MNGIAGWLIANLFLLALALIGAGIFFALFSLVQAAHFSADTEKFLAIVALLGAIFGTYYVGKFAHDRIERPRKR